MTRRPLDGSVLVSGDAASHARYNVAPATDYAVPRGRAVYAPFAGDVTRYWSITGGNTVRVQQSRDLAFVAQHLDGYAGATGHNAEGRQIGVSGNTGSMTDGPHVHCWVELDRERITFEDFISRMGGTETPIWRMTPDGTTPADGGITIGFLMALSDEQQEQLFNQTSAIYEAMFHGAKWADRDGTAHNARYGLFQTVRHNQTLIGRILEKLGVTAK